MPGQPPLFSWLKIFPSPRVDTFRPSPRHSCQPPVSRSRPKPYRRDTTRTPIEPWLPSRISEGSTTPEYYLLVNQVRSRDPYRLRQTISTPTTSALKLAHSVANPAQIWRLHIARLACSHLSPVAAFCQPRPASLTSYTHRHPKRTTPSPARSRPESSDEPSHRLTLGLYIIYDETDRVVQIAPNESIIHPCPHTPPNCASGCALSTCSASRQAGVKTTIGRPSPLP